MGSAESSAEFMEWLGDGYLEGDPVRYPLFVASMFAAMPLGIIKMLTG